MIGIYMDGRLIGGTPLSSTQAISDARKLARRLSRQEQATVVVRTPRRLIDSYSKGYRTTAAAGGGTCTR